MEKLSNFIAGNYRAPQGERYLPLYQPATGQIYGQVPDSSSADMDCAIAAAQAALPAWRKTTVLERAAILRKIATKIREQLEPLAAAESRDQGKPRWLARSVDIPRAAANFEFFASALEQNQEHCSQDGVGQPLHYTSRQGVGVCGLIVPWNLPLYLLTWKIAPALAMGNTVVAKPSELTPLTASLFAAICAEVGVPAGVVNLVFGTGTGVGAYLVAHPQVPLISFTGSTATGVAIVQASAAAVKKVSLELGGKNPALIFADAPWEKMLSMCLRSSFLNQGEICLSTSRIFVEEAVYPRFVAEFVARAQALIVGDPQAAETFIGPLVSREHCAKVLAYIEMARKWQGTIRCGGGAPRLPIALADGYYCAPTVITDLPGDCPLLHEEIFGPVVTISSFRDEEEVLGYANSSPYGLAACLWTSDLDRARRISEELAVGMVWVNTWMARDLRTPFGGMKASGLGREGGKYSLEFYSETKNICLG